MVSEGDAFIMLNPDAVTKLTYGRVVDSPHSTTRLLKKAALPSLESWFVSSVSMKNFLKRERKKRKASLPHLKKKNK